MHFDLASWGHSRKVFLLKVFICMDYHMLKRVEYARKSRNTKRIRDARHRVLKYLYIHTYTYIFICLGRPEMGS